MLSFSPKMQLLNSTLIKKIWTRPFSRAVSPLGSRNYFNKLGVNQSIRAMAFSQNASPSSNFSSLKVELDNHVDMHVINNRFLDKFQKVDDTEIFVINLNRPFSLQVLLALHKISSYTIMADGAANRFHDRIEALTHDSKDELIPHALVGDFDSVRKDVIESYKNRGVHVYHDLSQNDTDLEKCIKHLEKMLQDEHKFTANKTFKVIITGGFGGRIDHTLNNIHVLHKYAQRYAKYKNVSLHLMDNNSIGTCILPGITKYIRAKTFEKSAGCGLFPLLGVDAKVLTRGLKWDIGPGAPNMSFRDFISSSNEMIADEIEFRTNQPLFWATTNTIHGEASGN